MVPRMIIYPHHISPHTLMVPRLVFWLILNSHNVLHFSEWKLSWIVIKIYEKCIPFVTQLNSSLSCLSSAQVRHCDINLRLEVGVQMSVINTYLKGLTLTHVTFHVAQITRGVWSHGKALNCQSSVIECLTFILWWMELPSTIVILRSSDLTWG